MFFVVLSLFTALYFLGFSSTVVGQESEVVCASNYTWAENSFGQNPCVVASYLQGVCNPGFDVQILPPDTHYAPPEANECECNTVVYSLISACADCQGSFYLTWAEWSVNCTDPLPFIDTFPESIPVGTAVPAWAYLNVLNTGRYSPLAAEEDVGSPESTASTPTFTTSSSTSSSASSLALTPTTFTFGNSPTTPVSASSDSGSKKTNIGAIVGGVVGGLAVIALIGGLILFLVVRNRRSQIAPSAAYMDSKAPLASPPPMAQYPPAGSFAAQQNGGVPLAISPGSQYSTDPFLHQSKPYDPSDPSTFPNTAGYSVANSQGYLSESSSPGPSLQGYPAQTYPSVPSSPGYGSQYRGTPQV